MLFHTDCISNMFIFLLGVLRIFFQFVVVLLSTGWLAEVCRAKSLLVLWLVVFILAGYNVRDLAIGNTL